MDLILFSDKTEENIAFENLIYPEHFPILPKLFCRHGLVPVLYFMCNVQEFT